jgi:hypothetical protein
MLVLALAAMGGAMSMYWAYPFPNGHRPHFWGFIALFFREALLLAFFGGVVVLIIVAATMKAACRLFAVLRAQFKGSAQ